mgnify:CR=1 FL=1
MEKTDNLIKLIDSMKEIQDMKKKKKEVLEDKEFLKKLEEYKTNPTEELKEEILKNKMYREYLKTETDINILIMAINQKLKEIKEEGQCDL